MESIVQDSLAEGEAMRLLDLATKHRGRLLPLIPPGEIVDSQVLLNPSIASLSDGRFFATIRMTNFILSPEFSKERRNHKQELLQEQDVVFRSESIGILLDSNLNEVVSSKIELSQTKPQWHFQGLEDLRVVVWNGIIHLSGTRRDFQSDGRGRIEIVKVSFDEEKRIWKEISKSIPETSHDLFSYVEKNWAPVPDKPLTFVRWSYPTKIIQVKNWDSGESSQFERNTSKSNCPLDLRGGSQLVRWEGGYISFVHQSFGSKSYLGAQEYEYKHRIIFWNDDLEIQHVSSQPFDVMGGQVEFISGVSRFKDGLLVAFGFQDSCAFLLELPKRAVRELLEDYRTGE